MHVPTMFAQGESKSLKLQSSLYRNPSSPAGTQPFNTFKQQRLLLLYSAPKRHFAPLTEPASSSTKLSISNCQYVKNTVLLLNLPHYMVHIFKSSNKSLIGGHFENF